MDELLLLGRILFAMIFIGSGIGHLVEIDATTKAVEAKGLANPKVLAQVSGGFLLAGGLGIITGFWIDVAALGLAALVMIMAVTMHPFWEQEGEAQQLEMSMFMKNLSICGGCLIIFALYGRGFGPYTIVGPLFSF